MVTPAPHAILRPPRFDFARRNDTNTRPVVLPEGDLTLPLSRQKRLLRMLVASGLRAGLQASDAHTRATDCLTFLRDRALEYQLDSAAQETLKEYAVASMWATERDLGTTPGVTVAGKAWEALRLYLDYFQQRRYDETVAAIPKRRRSRSR